MYFFRFRVCFVLGQRLSHNCIQSEVTGILRSFGDSLCLQYPSLLFLSIKMSVFENEKAMLKQLEAMGMPPQMLANLTPEQKKAMFAMANNPETIAKAQERVTHEEDWKQEKDYEWKNTRDDVFVKLKGVAGDVQCLIEKDHMKISSEGKVLADRQLFQSVNVKESTWEVQGDTLAVSLRKEKAPMRWLSLYR